MRQYIGARYVPLIYQNPETLDNAWKSGVPYEPLTIVSYSGASYTSKKTVPAGVGNPADNPEYWINTGMYSGQTNLNTEAIAKIKQSISPVNEPTTTATMAHSRGDYFWCDGLLCQATANIAVGDVISENVNIRYETLRPVDSDFARKEFFRNKRILIAGDSLSDEVTMPPNWVSRFRDFTADVGATIINRSRGGIAAASVSGMAAAMQNFTDQNIDILIIEVGTNDANSQFKVGKGVDNTVETMCGALNLMHGSVVSKWPGAKVYYIIPPTCALTHEDSIIQKQYVPRCIYRYAIQCACNTFNWNIIDCGSGLPQFDLLDTTIKNMYSDGIHPNNAYSPIMMNYIVDQIISGGTTSIGKTGTTYNLRAFGLLNTTDFDVIDGQFAFYSDGFLRITIGATVKTAGDQILVPEMPEPLKSLFSSFVTTGEATKNDVPTNFLFYLGTIRMNNCEVGDRLYIDYYLRDPFLAMLRTTAVSR